MDEQDTTREQSGESPREELADLEDLEPVDDEAGSVAGGSYEPYITIKGQKQGTFKGTTP